MLFDCPSCQISLDVKIDIREKSPQPGEDLSVNVDCPNCNDPIYINVSVDLIPKEARKQEELWKKSSAKRKSPDKPKQKNVKQEGKRMYNREVGIKDNWTAFSEYLERMNQQVGNETSANVPSYNNENSLADNESDDYDGGDESPSSAAAADASMDSLYAAAKTNNPDDIIIYKKPDRYKDTPSEKAECPYCHDVFVKKHLRAHMRRHNAGYYIQCPRCTRKVKPGSLTKHMKIHEGVVPGYKRYGCHLCEKRFTSRYKLNEHLCTHTGKKNFSCKSCGKSYTTFNSLRRHIKRFCKGVMLANPEGASKEYFCEICGVVKSCPSKLRDHMLSHEEGKQFKCITCAKEFRHPFSLKRHVRSFCKGNLINDALTCEVCSREFKTITAKKRHMYIHSSEKNCVCDKCGARYRLPPSLYRHKLYFCKSNRVGEESFAKLLNETAEGSLEVMPSFDERIGIWECQICKQSFSSEDNYKKHSYTHTGIRPYKCGKCKTEFINKRHLQKHQSRPQCRMPAVKLSEEEKPYKCEICGKGFPKPWALRAHEVSHRGGVTCDKCGKNYKTNSSFYAHQKSCPGKPENEDEEEEQFMCEVCNKTYSALPLLATHLKVHNRELDMSAHEKKLIKCGECNKFLESCELRDHIKMSHGTTASCDKCSASFGSLQSYLEHRLDHLESDRHICQQCLKEFANSEDLRVHVTTEHVDIDAEYFCEKCGKEFSTEAILIAHKREHETQHACNKCPQIFNSQIKLKQHITAVHKPPAKSPGRGQKKVQIVFTPGGKRQTEIITANNSPYTEKTNLLTKKTGSGQTILFVPQKPKSQVQQMHGSAKTLHVVLEQK